ncbi:MAG TPA: class I SAM-dependent methyltransferase [Burkholderiales bacterium]|nr:class I SAM-dependent methyltransferase [Burkholderiales bacterium]
MIRTIAVIALCLPALALSQAPKKSAEQAWNDLYAKREGKEHQFNKFLAEAVKGKKPGTALDIGMGQGRNSLFLATLGWQVTGFDVSDVGVKQALAEAQKRDVKLDAQVGDVDKFDYGKNRYDLVVGMYMHDYLTRNASKVIASLKPGGMLVVEGIHRDISKDNLQGEKYGHRTNELTRAFGTLRIVYYQDTVDKADWERSGGKPVPVVRLIAVKEGK